MDFNYKKEDFETEAPYQAILAITSPFERDLALERMAAYAKTVGVNNFKKLCKSYQDALKGGKSVYIEGGVTAFTGQTLELSCGKWRCDDFGVSLDLDSGTEIVCPHPILPVERLVNIDTGEEKLRIAYSKGKRWREQIVPRTVLSSANKIVELSAFGVAVTSESAKLLVRYLCEIENENYDAIPEKSSIGRLGYIGDEGFSPYVEGLVFDGDANFKRIFSSVRAKGKSSVWKETAMECRKMSLSARILLAASFASVLVQPLGGLPFFCHLWGVDSGTGKTVGLMLAASVWGNPALGEYVQTFNGTVVGFEKMAEFLNSLPLCLDELQLAKDARGKQQFNVYQLAQGVGRTRGNKSGGIQKTPTWGNCIITTGESPLTSESDGAGAINRVIEIECTSDNVVIQDGQKISSLLKSNYGFAGRAFVKKIYGDPEVMDTIKARYTRLFRELSVSNTTEKQAMAAAMIVLADELITEWMFKDGRPLTVADIKTILKSRAAVSVGNRGYGYMCDWVVQNSLRMQRGVENGEVYGLIEGNIAYIIRSVFDQAAEKGGFSPAVLLSYFKAHDLIETHGKGKGNTKTKRINGNAVSCVCLRLPTIDEEAQDEEILI